MREDKQELVFTACKDESCSALFFCLTQFRADVGTSQQAIDLITVLFNSLNVALLTIHSCMPSRCNTVIMLHLSHLINTYHRTVMQRLAASAHANTNTNTLTADHVWSLRRGVDRVYSSCFRGTMFESSFYFSFSIFSDRIGDQFLSQNLNAGWKADKTELTDPRTPLSQWTKTHEHPLTSGFCLQRKCI